MKLNEAIEKALLDKIMPFDKWREIQTDPKARKRYEQEQEERQEREEQERLKSKYASMTSQDFENIWTRGDYSEIQEMFELAQIEEKQLEGWATDVKWGLHRLLINYLGGPEMTKGNFGNRAIARMAKSRNNNFEIREIARSTQQRRSNFRRNNLSPEELERRDREWEKQQHQRDEKSAEYQTQRDEEEAERQRQQLQQDKERWCRNCNEEEMREFAKTGPIGNGETLRRFLSIPNMTDEIMAIAAARINHPNLAEIIIDAAGGPDSTDNYGDRTIKVLTKSKHPKTRALAQSAKQSRRKARGFWIREHRVLTEAIEKSLLDKIPNFDDWREGGGSMAGYYKDKLEKEYHGSTVRILPSDELGEYKWALAQYAEGPDDMWTEEQAKRMSNLIHNYKFYYRYHSYHDGHSYFEAYAYYLDGKADSYRDQGY